MFITVLGMYSFPYSACLVLKDKSWSLINTVTQVMPGLLLAKAILSCRSTVSFSINSFVRAASLDLSSGQPRAVKVLKISKLSYLQPKSVFCVDLELWCALFVPSELDGRGACYHWKRRAASRTDVPPVTASKTELLTRGTMSYLHKSLWWTSIQYYHLWNDVIHPYYLSIKFQHRRNGEYPQNKKLNRITQWADGDYRSFIALL